MPAVKELHVNGARHAVAAEAARSLLSVLRDHLDLTGAKYGCGEGQCGACTVLIDGLPRRSCITQVGAVGSKAITTIEGLSADGTHPVQLAWQEIDVAQCGYCQVGQMMSAAALLAKTPKPTDKDVDAAMNGNLCRCGTYLRIRQAVHKAAELATSASARTLETARNEPQ